jgi:hypothetical protein
MSRPPIKVGGIDDKLLAVAKELRPDDLTLWMFRRNARARRFYEARGFVVPEFADRQALLDSRATTLYSASALVLFVTRAVSETGRCSNCSTASSVYAYCSPSITPIVSAREQK